jgi:uncharacterized DUF497 family protein
MRFEWDEEKHERNIRERGIGFDIAARIFEGRTVEWLDDRFDYGEGRICAIGEADSGLLMVVYTLRGDVHRIISARRANRKERRQW